MEHQMVKTLRFTPLPARVHVDQTANTARADINMTFTTAGARAVRHRAEAEEARRSAHAPGSDRASRLSTTRAPTGG